VPDDVETVPLQRKGRRLRVRRVAAVTLLVLLSPVTYSYVTTMTRPSSLPLWPRSAEWLRAHHGSWLVDEVEHYYYYYYYYYYTWKAPAPGGPQLTTLPLVGIRPERPAAVRTVRTSRLRRHAAGWPPPVKPVFSRLLPGEGVWAVTGPLVRRRPAVMVTTFRTERDYPRIVAYAARFDHTRTSIAFHPGRYEPPSAPVRGAHGGSWPTLITYTHHGGLDPVKVVPNYQQPVTRYLVPDDRDFFAVYRRVRGPVTVPFR
jgi:hypothetical protein